jgi:putative nucleotidyltransferase with HDIG domain
MLGHVLPELAEGIGVQQRDRHLFDVFEHSLRTCDAIAADRLDLRLAALLHDIGKPRSLEIQGDGDRTFHGHDKTSAEMADSILARLRFPNDVRKHVSTLVRHHMFDYTPESTDASVRRLLRRVGPENIDDLIALRQADRIAVRGDREAGAAWASEMHQRIDTIANRDDALSLGDLTVNGDDLCAVGIPAGPRMGVVLDFLLESVLDDPTLNKRDRLLEIAERYYRTRVDPH